MTQIIIPFTKMHGCGNDYIYVDVIQHPIVNPQACAVAWSDRHKGIGSDGLVLIDRSPVPEADFSMRIFNADGSEAMMCGNASRCIGKYLYERGLTDKTVIRLLTLSGVKTLLLHIDHALPLSSCGKDALPLPSHQGEGLGVGSVTSVTVDMGEPSMRDDSQFVGNRGLSQGTFVSMGNPHYVIFTDNIDQVAATGRILEYHPAFPQRCNIEFAKILAMQVAEPSSDPTPDPSPTREGSGCATIRTRVWERGSGVTMACGTGACATAVAACLSGRAGRESDIVMDGGTLHIEWRESDNHVYMTGSAAFVFDGEIEINE
jgi:diaminopimelate epimerase